MAFITMRRHLVFVCRSIFPRCVRLLRHLEADAHAVVALADVADGTQGGVAAQCTQRLYEGEELLRLEEDAHAVGLPGGEAGDAQQQTLHRDGVCALVEGVGATPRLAVYL